MTLRRLTTLFFLLALVAGATSVAGADSVLTSDGTRFSIEVAADRPQLVITRAAGDTRDRIVVPTTDDEAIESQANLAFDAATGTLYVAWSRDLAGISDIRVTSMRANGAWSVPIVVSGGSGQRRALQVVLTHAETDIEDLTATLLHMAWWKINGTTTEPEYGLVAFESGESVSTHVANLDTLAALVNGASSNPEDTGVAMHPPMTMARNGSGVDVVFGAVNTTALTRLTAVPVHKIQGTVRMWTPLGRNAARTPKASLVSLDGSPVQAFLSNGRVVLYTPGAKQFRFVLLIDGRWSPERKLRVDNDLTADDLLDDLRRTVEELEDGVATAEPESK